MAEIDKTIQQLFDKLNQRKQKVSDLKARVAKAWKTNGTYRMFGAPTPTSIQTASKEVILEIATQLCLLEDAHATAATRLEQPASNKVQGYTFEDWFGDLKKRLAAIDVREEENQLAILESRLNQVLSPEERRRIEVELLSKEIGE
jgi:hypothetical protein